MQWMIFGCILHISSLEYDLHWFIVVEDLHLSRLHCYVGRHIVPGEVKIVGRMVWEICGINSTNMPVINPHLETIINNNPGKKRLKKRKEQRNKKHSGLPVVGLQHIHLGVQKTNVVQAWSYVSPCCPLIFIDHWIHCHCDVHSSSYI